MWIERRQQASGARRTVAAMAAWSALSAVVVGLMLVGPAAPVALARGCGPGVLGSATEWKDRNPVYDFTAACDWHDRCYAARGFGWDPRLQPDRAVVPYPRRWCDDGFLHGMSAACDRLRGGNPRNALCHSVANLFHGLVRLFGGPAYASADGHRVLTRLTWP